MAAFCERTLSFDYGESAMRGARVHRFPAITERFASPMLAERNLQLGTGVFADELVQRVIDGLKPVAFIDSTAPERMRSAAVRALASGCAAACHRSGTEHGPACWFTSVAQTGRVAERFDLDALAADYRAYFPEHPDLADAVKRELDRLGRFDISDFLAFADVEINHGAIYGDSAHPAPELARCGLLLGYPVWSTAALAGAWLKLPGYRADELRL